MDTTVQLVQAYLQVNGYLTVTEYPILETRGQDSRTLSDLDVLAFRFPHAATEIRKGKGRRRRLRGDALFETDPALAVPEGDADMIVGEVKRGQARFNSATRDADVLAVALMRFGCCPIEEARNAARVLTEDGVTRTHQGHAIRMVAFGGHEPERGTRWHTVTLAQIESFLRGHLEAHWDLLKMVQFSNPALDLLSLLHRAERAAGGLAKIER